MRKQRQPQRHFGVSIAIMVLVVFFFSGLLVFHLFFSGELSPDSLISSSRVSSQLNLPPVPRLYQKEKMKRRLESMLLKSRVELPIQPGDVGRENPFTPFEEEINVIIDEEGNIVDNNILQETVNSQEDIPKMSEGSK